MAVRSSATAEDLPDASFAGQQETLLGVTGTAELAGAVRKCWESLRTERVDAYREAHRIGESEMAVVVQRMIDPVVAGVLFTADPITGRRTAMVVDAAPGLGSAVVDGTVVPDHYVLERDAPAEPEGGCLTSEQLDDLRAAGRRLQALFGSPQDIEWAIDREGVLWLLQSRPITTLFPAPPDSGLPGPRVYLELGAQFQGVVRPLTPMGISAGKAMMAGLAGSFGGKGTRDEARDGDGAEDADGGGLVEIGGRLFLDATGTVRNEGAAKWLPKVVGADFGPRVRAVVEHVLEDPRFAPLPGTGGSGVPFRAVAAGRGGAGAA
ncbi:PEP/pyruvate-binding domain-containing protein [Actinomadura viridis]|uniref:PEP/pyruvate-binding domain-containing protein n=1 Tax=Actinomadura viridis TaxID=58110 RepID=UPI003690C735